MTSRPKPPLQQHSPAPRKPLNAWARPMSNQARSPPPIPPPTTAAAGGPGPGPVQVQQTQTPTPPQAQSPPTQPHHPLSPQSQNGFPPLGAKSTGAAVAGAVGPQSGSPLVIPEPFTPLLNSPISVFLKGGARWGGILSNVNQSAQTITLATPRDLLSPSPPEEKEKVIKMLDIEAWSPAHHPIGVVNGGGPGPAGPGNGFRTDTDISGAKWTNRERELEPWTGTIDGLPQSHGGNIDEVTFGPLAGGQKWDQFAANEAKFGVQTSFDESLYTTVLDRNKPGFREREKEAERLAGEIQGTATSNPHLAEERGRIDDSGLNEEDRYGAVVRGAGAYVPPGARKGPVGGTTAIPANAGATPPPPTTSQTQPPAPMLPINPNATSASISPPPSTPQATGAAPAAGSEIPKVNVAGPTGKSGAEGLVSDFRVFVASEKNRLSQKKAAIAKSEMDKRKAELMSFSKSFKLNKPIPDDLVPILAKDEKKQAEIKEKSKEDALSSSARKIGPSALVTAGGTNAPVKPKLPVLSGTSGGGAKGSVPPAATGAGATTTGAGTPAAAGVATTTAASTGTKKPTLPSSSSTGVMPSTSSTAAAASAAAGGPKKIKMVLQSIPPFNPSKLRPPTAGLTGSVTTSSIPTAAAVAAAAATEKEKERETVNVSLPPPQTPRERDSGPIGLGLGGMDNKGGVGRGLNITAPSFKPGAPQKASGSGSGNTSAGASPTTKNDAPTHPNPFFGTRVPKKSAPVHIKDEFNPFKHDNPVPTASTIPAAWNYTGKRYTALFPPVQSVHQQPPPMHMAPPPPVVQPPAGPPPPAAQYEEDPTRANAGTPYVYYAPYYPAQPHQQMVPAGMPPPPGQYIAAPYMQMHYPPGMPPGGPPMYPPMQMTHPSHFMGPPPTGYPPPNGNGPRPSMPPTPVPSHAHPAHPGYPYHQSPQIQHAVPYPMMMQPHPGGPTPPQHVYEAGQQPPPPVTMGNHT